MTLNEILDRIGIGDLFYRQSKPEILYDRIGTLIEKDGRGWASLIRQGREYQWIIFPEMRNAADDTAADWVLEQGNCYKKYDECKAAKPKKRFNIWKIDEAEELLNNIRSNIAKETATAQEPVP